MVLTVEDRDGFSRQPLLYFPLPVELQRGGADYQRRIRLRRVDRGERLDGFSEPHLLGDEGPFFRERIGAPGSLEWSKFTAESRYIYRCILVPRRLDALDVRLGKLLDFLDDRFVDLERSEE